MRDEQQNHICSEQRKLEMPIAILPATSAPFQLLHIDIYANPIKSFLGKNKRKSNKDQR